MFDSIGLHYGPRYRTLVNVWGGASGALARLRARLTQEDTMVHPADLDDAFCTGNAIASNDSNETRLPFAVDDALLQGARGELWAVRSRIRNGPFHRSVLTALAYWTRSRGCAFAGCGAARA